MHWGEQRHKTSSMSLSLLLSVTYKRHTQTHDCHTDLDFLQLWSAHVVGRVFLLSVLEILIFQLILTNTQSRLNEHSEVKTCFVLGLSS